MLVVPDDIVSPAFFDQLRSTPPAYARSPAQPDTVHAN
jgi:hypothetical protein